MERITNGPYIFEKGMDFILYNLFDTLVDDYFPLTDSIGDEIDDIEETILQNPKKQVQDDILVLKRNILKLRKVLSPQREVLNILLRHDFDLIKEENRLYYMDVYEGPNHDHNNNDAPITDCRHLRNELQIHTRA